MGKYLGREWEEREGATKKTRAIRLQVVCVLSIDLNWFQLVSFNGIFCQNVNTNYVYALWFCWFCLNYQTNQSTTTKQQQQQQNATPNKYENQYNRCQSWAQRSCTKGSYIFFCSAIPPVAFIIFLFTFHAFHLLPFVQRGVKYGTQFIPIKSKNIESVRWAFQVRHFSVSAWWVFKVMLLSSSQVSFWKDKENARNKCSRSIKQAY